MQSACRRGARIFSEAGETLTVTVAGREVAELSPVRKHRWVSGPTLDRALLARDQDERARRTDRLAVVEATFDPLPISVEVARAWGRLTAAVAQRGGQPRRRQLDLAIAATASVNQVPLFTLNLADFRIIDDLVDARQP